MVRPSEPERHPDVEYDPAGDEHPSAEEIRRAAYEAARQAGVEESVTITPLADSLVPNELRSESRVALGIILGSALVILAAVLPFALIEGTGWRPAIGFYGASFLAIVFTGVGVGFASRRRHYEARDQRATAPIEDVEEILREHENALEFAQTDWAVAAIQERTARKLRAIGVDQAAEILMREVALTDLSHRERERGSA